MARTKRRQSCRYDYAFLLTDYEHDGQVFRRFLHDPHSSEGIRILAKYHSDRYVGIRSTAPRPYCRFHSKKIKGTNNATLRKWLRNPDTEPVFQDNHLHGAGWHWW